MRTWKIAPKDPQTLTLAADSRLTALDYTNDQIWELLLGKGDPAAILLQTTYGLRARNMRIFPQFEEAHKVVSDPEDFAQPLAIQQFAPNYLRMGFSPFPGIDVILEYWVPDCQTVSSRIMIKNSSELNRNIQLAVCALLNPNTAEGQPMRPKRIEVANVLQGQTENLAPVLFITGGAGNVASPYPGLVHNLTLEPGQFRRFTWVLASMPDVEQSFRHARLTATQNFDYHIGQIEMLAAQQLEIYTGDLEWDLAFAMGEKTALGLIHSPSLFLKYPSFVTTRLPDQGYSSQGSGIDYNHLWNGQSALETWYLMQYLLPGHADLAKGILSNFLEVQDETGYIDFKPGLAGQRSNILAAPLLVSAAWAIFQATNDREFLEKVFRPLFRFILVWFEPKHDRDGDGVPEWTSVIQSGFDQSPTFCPWLPWAQGADSTLIESPDLSAYLYRECQLLLKMAKLLNYQEPVGSLTALAENLQRAVQSSWNSRRASFQYWDRETHQTRKGELLGKQQGSGSMSLEIVFELPARLLVRLESSQLPPPKVEVEIRGSLSSGASQEQEITTESIAWQQGICTITLPDLYAEVEQVTIRGLPDDGEASLLIIDHTLEDHTLLTPMWAGIASADQVEKLIKRKLHNKLAYFRNFGISACPKPGKKSREGLCDYIWLPWNVMVGEALLAYGKREEAVDLITRIMPAITRNLKHEQAFRSHYHADDPISAGQRNALFGLPPAGLFMEALGIRPISPWKVEIANLNPFPWDVRVKYRGMHIESTSEYVTIIFPDGQDITLYDKIPCLVEHEPSAMDGNDEGR
jgi:hypothetical protein